MAAQLSRHRSSRGRPLPIHRMPIGAAIAGEGRDMRRARHQWRGRPGAKQRLARQCRSPKPAHGTHPRTTASCAAGGRARDLHRDLDRVRAAGREQHLREPTGAMEAIFFASATEVSQV